MSDPITMQMEHLRQMGYTEEQIQDLMEGLVHDTMIEVPDEELETFRVEYGGEEVRRL